MCFPSNQWEFKCLVHVNTKALTEVAPLLMPLCWFQHSWLCMTTGHRMRYENGVQKPLEAGILTGMLVWSFIKMYFFCKRFWVCRNHSVLHLWNHSESLNPFIVYDTFGEHIGLISDLFVLYSCHTYCHCWESPVCNVALTPPKTDTTPLKKQLQFLR